MGNSISQRHNSSSSLSLYFFNSVIGSVFNFSKQKTHYIPKYSSLVGLTGVFGETMPFQSNSEYIAFRPTLTALDILFSALGELWKLKHPKSRDFQAKRGFSACDLYIIPMSPNEITSSEEYTCVVSIKDGCPIMTHSYGGMVIDYHHIPRSMGAATLGGGNRLLSYAGESPDDSKFEECLKRCYICGKDMQQMSDTPTHKNGYFGDNIGLNNGVKATKENKDNKS